jgi:protein ImuA
MPTGISKSALLDDLRRRIGRLERTSEPHHAARPALAFGVDEVDHALPWGGLMAAALHEIAPETANGAADGIDHLPAALGFAAALLGRAALSGPVLWGRTDNRAGARLHAPGLASFGLNHNNLILVNCAQARQIPWVMEEGLRSGAVAAVLGEMQQISSVAARRLQLAAETGGTLAMLVTAGGDDALVAATRWRIAAATSPHPAGPHLANLGPGPARWRATLWRCRGTAAVETDPRHWLLEWHDEDDERPGAAQAARGFRLAAPLRHGPLRPARESGGTLRERIARTG